MKSNIFCIKRLYYLLRRQIFGNNKKYFLGLGSIIGTLLLITLLSGIGSTNFHISVMFSFYIVTFLFGGYVFTSSVFSELNSPGRSVAALTLPVSNLERLAGAWLISAVVYPIIAVVGILLISLGTGLVHGQLSVSNIIFVILSKSTFSLIGIYIITQSVFLFGAIYFRKHNFFKTIGATLLVSFFLLGVFILIVYALFGGEGIVGGGETTLRPNFERFLSTIMIEFTKFAFCYLLAPYFWLLTWLGIKEREV